jgi:Zn-dependent protease with chaperone function
LGAATAWAGLAFAILTVWVVAITAGAVIGGIVCLRVALEQGAGGMRIAVAGAGILLAAGVAVQGVLFWLPLGRYQVTGDRPLDPGESEDLRRLVAQVAREVGTRPPAQIFLTGEVNAYASFHRGLPGALAGDSKLTVGLPLLAGQETDELRAILAHELAHFRDAAAMRVCAVAFEIEGGLTRMTGYGSRRIRNWHLEKQRITVLSVAGLAFATLGEQVAAALVVPLWGPCQRLRERLVIAMEFRADAAAARAVGTEAVVGALESMALLVAAWAENDGGNNGLRPGDTDRETAIRNAARRFRERRRREGKRGRSVQWQGDEASFILERIERLRTQTGAART